MKKIILINCVFWFVYFFTSNAVFAQRMYNYSQFFLNPQLVNPAFTGIDEFTKVTIGHRNQWMGFEGAPVSNYAGVSMRIGRPAPEFVKQYSLRISNPEMYDSLLRTSASKRENLQQGVGGYLTIDKQGPFSQVSGFGNYAIHFEINEKTKLSVGGAVGFYSNRFNMADIRLRNPDSDALYQNLLAGGGRSSFLDSKAGVVLYKENIYLGYAANQLAMIPLGEVADVDFGKTFAHHISGGFKFQSGLRSEMLLSSQIVIADTYNSFWELSAKMRMQDLFWFGTAYRSSNALSFMAGTSIRNQLIFGYSFDQALSNITAYSNGTHEIFLALMLSKRDSRLPFVW
ncbi:MAG: PorP/SprF family type IX secretion system membrane protein [Cyclobacteriaceae bacterium]|nr:PorP/SprF family type IX secretion system membrane protein [Cyclobacteriaceae bacterium]